MISTVAARSHRIWASVCTLAVLAACAPLGPNYQRAEPLSATSTTGAERKLPPQYKESAALANTLLQAASTLPLSATDWWKPFSDPTLDALMVQVGQANQNVAQAEAKYRQAVATTQQAQAAGFPTLGTNASATRSSQAANGVRTTSQSLSTGLSASWELDLWGRVRRSIELGEASAAASALDLAATTLSLQAQLATNYGALRALDVQRSLLEDSVAAYQRSLQLTRNRYDAGVVAKADVAQAQSQLLSSQAQLIDTGAQRATLEHSIAVLTGRLPSELTITRVDDYPLRLPAVAATTPSQLLQRRPDIAAAERRMASANAQIGIAVAAYYPTISISGSLGQRGTTLTDLLSLPNRFWSLGPTLALSLFDGGARDASKAQALASYDHTVALYRQTILSAIQEVEDNLSTLRVLAEELVVQQQAVLAAQEALAITLNQYKAGTVSFLNVATAQTAEYSARRTELALRSQQFVASVALIKALGG